MHDAAKRGNRDILVLCHGGPIAEPSDAQYVLDRTEGVVGFYGASSMERLRGRAGDHQPGARVYAAKVSRPEVIRDSRPTS